MSQISILIVVDTDGALAAGSLKNNIHSIDTEGYLGSWGEGTNSLHTICRDGQTLVWRIVSVNPENPVSLTGFSGRLVDGGICRPELQNPDGEPVWQGRIESRGQFASFDYTAGVRIGAAQLSFVGTLKIV